jgi:hypothetical protein
MARTIREKIIVESRAFQNNKATFTFSVIEKGKLFYLLFNISANFEINSYFEASSIEGLKEELRKSLCNDEESGITTLTINENENEIFIFSRELDADLWNSVRISVIDMNNCLTDLSIGKLLAEEASD